MDGHSKRGGGGLTGFEATPRNTNQPELSAVLLRTQTRTSTAVERVTIVTSYAFLHRMQIRCSSHWHTYMVTQVPVYFKIENKKNVFFLYMYKYSWGSCILQFCTLLDLHGIGAIIVLASCSCVCRQFGVIKCSYKILHKDVQVWFIQALVSSDFIYEDLTHLLSF